MTGSSRNLLGISESWKKEYCPKSTNKCLRIEKYLSWLKHGMMCTCAKTSHVLYDYIFMYELEINCQSWSGDPSCRGQPCHVRKTLFCSPPLSPLVLTMFPPPFINSPWALGRAWERDVPSVAERFTVTYSFYLDQLWVSTWATIHSTETFLMGSHSFLNLQIEWHGFRG